MQYHSRSFSSLLKNRKEKEWNRQIEQAVETSGLTSDEIDHATTRQTREGASLLV